MTKTIKTSTNKIVAQSKDKKNSGHTFGQEPPIQEPKKHNQTDKYEASSKNKKK